MARKMNTVTQKKKNAKAASPASPAPDTVTPFSVLETVQLAPDQLDTTATHKGRLAPVPDDAVNAMAASMLTNGQLQPIQAFKVDGGKPKIIFGFTRQRAAERIVGGFAHDGKTYPANPDYKLRVELVEKPSDDDILIRTLSENAQRNRTNRIEDAYNQQLLRDCGHTDVAIARIYGYASSASVMRIRQLLELSPRWQEKVAKEEVTGQAASLIVDWGRGNPDAQDRLLDRLVTADPAAAENLGNKGAEWLIESYGAVALHGDAPDATAAPLAAPNGAAAPAAPDGAAAPAAPGTNGDALPATPVKKRAATASEIKQCLDNSVDPVIFKDCDEQTSGVIIAALKALQAFAKGDTVFAAFVDELRTIAK